MVLLHQVHIRLKRQFFCEEGCQRGGSGDPSRHHQVSHEHAAPGDPILVQLQISHLAVHFTQRSTRRLRVVPRQKVFCRVFFIPHLEIRHVDVNYAVQVKKRFERIVPGGVIHEGQMQTAFDGDHERFQDLRHHVRGGDEVDVMTSHFLQGEHHPCQSCRPGLGKVAALADVVILAEDAAQVALGEEDRSAAAPAAQWIFLAVVGEEAAHARISADLAGARLPGETVCAAGARAHTAIG